MMSRSIICKGFKDSALATRKHAKTFYYCSLFLNKEKRMAAYAVYGFSRSLDDTFDGENTNCPGDPASWHARIDNIFSDSQMCSPSLLALRHTVKKYDIPPEYFHELVNGMEMDLVKAEYRDFAELYEYCYRVAGVVGLIMAKIFGYSNDDALLYAEKMGVAMQLTNILRDIKEDQDMGRTYLPSDELRQYGISPEMLRSGTVDDNFVQFMNFQIDRARSFYKEGLKGIPLIQDRNSRFIARLMGSIYSGILDSIIKNGYDVFSERAYVPLRRKIFLTAGMIMKN